MEAEWNFGAPPKLGAASEKERQWGWRKVGEEPRKFFTKGRFKKLFPGLVSPKASNNC